MTGDEVDLDIAKEGIREVFRNALLVETARLTNDRRKPSLTEVRDAGIAVGLRVLSEQRAIHGAALGYNLVRIAAIEARYFAEQNLDAINASMAAFLLGAVLFRTDLL